MENRRKELLDEIAFMIGDRYISDLHNGTYLPLIKEAVVAIHLENYSLEQWNAAAQYIGCTEKVFGSLEEARDFITSL